MYPLKISPKANMYPHQSLVILQELAGRLGRAGRQAGLVGRLGRPGGAGWVGLHATLLEGNRSLG